MSKWEMVRLGDVCDNKIKSIPANYDKEMYYVDIASVDNERKEITIYQRISGKEAPSRAKQILRYQDVIVSTVRPNLNAVAIYKAKQEIDVIASTGYCVLRSQEKILPAYLFSFCKSTSFIVRLTKIAKGASYPAVSNSDVRALELPLPSLEEQKKIANELDKIDDLIAKRKEQIEKLDLLIKAKFIEMFGDPVTNPMRWGKASLSMLGELNRGVSKHRPRNDPSLLGGVYPLIQTGEIANADLYITFYKNTYSELGLKQSRLWKNGTLCITIAANIAKTAILKFDACFPDSVVGFFPNERTNQIFIHYWFSFFQQILEAQAPESAQKNINLKILSELEIVCPAIELQNQFADYVKNIEQNKTKLQAGLAQLELLYKQRMQYYFE